MPYRRRIIDDILDAAILGFGHLRTRNTEHEIDLVVEASDRSTVAIEVTFADAVTSADVVHLNWLGGRLGDRLVDRVVVHTGDRAYRRDDGVAVVPLALLGPGGRIDLRAAVVTRARTEVT